MKTRSLKQSAAVLFTLLLLVSCVSTRNTQTAQQEKKEPSAEAPLAKKLDKKYENILVSPFTIQPQLAKDYPEAARTLQKSMMTALQEEKTFAHVGTDAGAMPAKGNTLLIKAEITNMRIVSDSARIWGGAFAGSSGVELDLQLIDGKTGKAVRTKKMSSWNNSFAAAWSYGSSDHSLLDDMGKILAGYVVESMPEK